jgi:hypothetical protein
MPTARARHRDELSREPVQYMPLQWMPPLKTRVIEVVRGIMRHA